MARSCVQVQPAAKAIVTRLSSVWEVALNCDRRDQRCLSVQKFSYAPSKSKIACLDPKFVSCVNYSVEYSRKLSASLFTSRDRKAFDIRALQMLNTVVYLA